MVDKIKGFQDTIDWYDSRSEKYAENIESIQNISLIDKFVKAVGKGKTVLDAGCAAGRDCRLLKDRGLKPVGLDLSKGLLEIARKKHPVIKFQHGNMLELPFENEKNTIIDKDSYYQRDSTVVEVSDELVAFQVNDSAGTQDTIDKAKKKNIPVKIFSYSI